jgi:transglutaminase-like putative cysteine protease
MTGRRVLASQLRPTLAAAGAVALTTLALSPTLADGPWFMTALLVIAAVAVVGGSGRVLSMPGWIVVALQGLALLLLLTVIFAGDSARFGLLPGTEAWRTFVDLANEGGVVLEQEVAPVTVTEGVRFLVVTGVALIAWAVDAMAVTWRRASLAGIPLLTLYLVPATVLPDGVPWPLFVAAGAGWLLLLLEDGRLELSRWGRPIEGDTGGRLHSVGGTGRRLGAAALTVAVIVPVILPSLDDGRFGGGGTGDGSGEGGSGDAGAGEQRVLTVNPITDLQRNLTQAEDAVVLYYTTTATTPEYLRIATLDRFDGESWNLEEMQAGSDQQAARGLPSPPGLSEEIARSVVDYDITVGPLDTPRLPLPYPASVVDIEGDWRWDADSFDVFSAEENGSAFDQSYSASVLALSPTVDQLRAAAPPTPSLNPMTDLPEEVAQRLTPLTATVTRDALTNYDRALALQNWFRTEFDYSLDTVEGNSATALDSFLRDRSGYCEQFAATMALMARTLDIPSRVQVGFTPGEVTQDAELADGDIWVVSTHDAHAWPELWFEGVGWVRFEPTPGGGDGGATPGYAPVPQPETQNPSGDRGNQGGGVVIRRGGGPIGDRGRRPPELRDVLEANRGRQAVGSASSATESEQDNGSAALLWLTLAAALAAAVAAPKVASLTVRRARWRDVESGPAAISAAWADVLDAATDVDLPAAATETPRDLAARIPARGGLRGHRADELRQLAGWVELLRYRGSVGATPSVAELRQLSDGVRSELMDALSPRDRRRATWWPTSGRLALLAAWNGLSDGLAMRWQQMKSRVGATARRRGGAPSAPRSAS